MFKDVVTVVDDGDVTICHFCLDEIYGHTQLGKRRLEEAREAAERIVDDELGMIRGWTMTTREQPYATYEEVEVVVCDRCGDECEPTEAVEYALSPEPHLARRISKLYTKYWHGDTTPKFPEGVTIETDLKVELCLECDDEYVGPPSVLARMVDCFRSF